MTLTTKNVHGGHKNKCPYPAKHKVTGVHQLSF